jgi:hypothetical protein
MRFEDEAKQSLGRPCPMIDRNRKLAARRSSLIESCLLPAHPGPAVAEPNFFKNQIQNS